MKAETTYQTDAQLQTKPSATLFSWCERKSENETGAGNKFLHSLELQHNQNLTKLRKERRRSHEERETGLEVEEAIHIPANKAELNHWSVKLKIWMELTIFVTFVGEANSSSCLEAQVDKRHIVQMWAQLETIRWMHQHQKPRLNVVHWCFLQLLAVTASWNSRLY